MVDKFVCHGAAHRIAGRFGWLPGARYTELRNVREVERLGFLDIDWKNYSFDRHLRAAQESRPLVTVARDLELRRDLSRVIEEAWALSEHAETVVVVPKDRALEHDLNELIPDEFRLGYSVPTIYGGTSIPPASFRREVHLLGGRPDVQRALGRELRVASLDCNRFMLDAGFGDYFDGETFRPHPVGGFTRCIEASLANINKLWQGYEAGAGAALGAGGR